MAGGGFTLHGCSSTLRQGCFGLPPVRRYDLDAHPIVRGKHPAAVA